MIPNICHFVFGLQPQTEDFLFCYYLAVHSCQVINRPDRICFHYHHEPRGEWWEKTKEVPGFEMVRVDVPELIGKKRILRTAHKADVVRMRVLHEIGGVYLDIDTVCVRPWTDLLQHQVVLGKEKRYPGVPDGICNAIMMAAPGSMFFAEWIARYPLAFAPEGWREASIVLPRVLAARRPSWLVLKEAPTFFVPSWNETTKIFTGNVEIPHPLIALHLWESHSMTHLKAIGGWDWASRNATTLYGRIMELVRATSGTGGRDRK